MKGRTVQHLLLAGRLENKRSKEKKSGDEGRQRKRDGKLEDILHMVALSGAHGVFIQPTATTD